MGCDFVVGVGASPGAINVQIYRLIKGWTTWDIARRVALAFFGIISGTEENSEFLKSKVLYSKQIPSLAIYTLQDGLFNYVFLNRSQGFL